MDPKSKLAFKLVQTWIWQGLINWMKVEALRATKVGELNVRWEKAWMHLLDIALKTSEDAGFEALMIRRHYSCNWYAQAIMFRLFLSVANCVLSFYVFSCAEQL